MKARLICLLGLALLVTPILLVAHQKGTLPLLSEFPPRTQTIDHPGFHPAIFGAFCMSGLLSGCLLARPLWFGFKKVTMDEPGQPGAAFPPWGYAGIALVASAWILAWGKFESLELPSRHYFFPLWLGYILTVDGLVFRRSGTSRIVRNKAGFWWLFPASSLAWWYFEVVNRMVQNWWYEGVEHYSGAHYIGLATLSFSTVFPAIFETRDLLMTRRWFREAYKSGPAWPAATPCMSRLLLIAGVMLVGATAWWPVPLFFLTWIAPLLIAASTLALAGVPSPFTDAARGDYTSMFSLAVAALICGWFWEMWNYLAMPKWIYTVPFVQAMEVFEMPLPGFTGYLPFGPICFCFWLLMKTTTVGGQKQDGQK